MARRLRVLILVATAALAFLAAANVGVAKPVGPSTRQAPCNFSSGGMPATPCTLAGQTFATLDQLMTFCRANSTACGGFGAPSGGSGGSGGTQPPQGGTGGTQPPQGGGSGGQQLQPCPAGVQPTPQFQCIPSSGGGGGQTQMQPCAAGQQPSAARPCIPSSMGGNGGSTMGGGMPGGMIDYGNLKPCDPGTVPTPGAPCKFDMPDCADGQMPSMTSPCKPKPCAPGAKPTKSAPCMPDGQDGGFDAPPSASISKDMKNKFMVININVQGSGDANGSFDVTFKSVEEGVNKTTAAYLNDQLGGESFVINTDAGTKCFADTKDPDKIPDQVSCKELDDAANNAPGSIKAQFRGKVTFDAATFAPKFDAQKIVFLKGVFNVAKIGG